MIHNIRAAFNELLADIDWMDDETRAVAKDKADAMNERIGYPDVLTNRTELEKEYANVSVFIGPGIHNNILEWLLYSADHDCRRSLSHKRVQPAVVGFDAEFGHPPPAG